MASLAGLIHGGLVVVVIVSAAVAAGLAAYGAAPPFEKKSIGPLVPADLGR
jgi:hypothetical protein